MLYRNAVRTAVLLLTGCCCTLAVAADFKVNGALPKTPPARKEIVLPFLQELGGWNVEARENGGKPPQDARERAQRLDGLGPLAKAEVEGFTRRMAASGESREFDAWVATEFAKLGHAGLVADLKQAGGATAALQRLGPWIDAEVGQRRQAADQQRSALWLGLLGINEAHAMRYTGSRFEMCMTMSTTGSVSVSCLYWAAFL